MEGVLKIKYFFPSSIYFLPNPIFLLSFIFRFVNILGTHSLQKEDWQNQLRSEAATGGVLSEKMFLKILQNSQENICVRVSFLIKLLALACKFIERDSGTDVFCEFCEISRNTLFTEHLWATASVRYSYSLKYSTFRGKNISKINIPYQVLSDE